MLAPVMRAPRCTILATAVSLAFAPVAAAEIGARQMKQAIAYSQQAGKAMQAQDHAQAEGLYKKALVAVPSFPGAHLGMGHIALAAKRYTDALAEYEAAREGYLALGEAMLDLQNQRYRDAQRDKIEIRDAIQETARAGAQGGRGANDTSTRQRIAQLEEQLRQLDAITPPTPQASKGAPPEVFFHIGNAQFRLDRTEEARQSWEACAAGNPGFPVVHNNLAVVYFKLGRVEDAKKSLARAKELGFPVNPQFEADLIRAAGQS